MGSLAVCYRRDLFEAAGLPSERDQVSALWPTWDQFIATGQRYKTATGKGMLDSITSATNAVLFQSTGDLFYDKDDNLYVAGTAPADRAPEKLIAANSPGVKAAWDTAHEDQRRRDHRQDPDLVTGVECRLQAGHVRRRPSARPGCSAS